MVNKDSETSEHICKLNKGKDVLLVTDNNTGEIMCATCGEVIVENVAELGPESSAQYGEDYMSKSRTGRKSTASPNQNVNPSQARQRAMPSSQT